MRTVSVDFETVYRSSKSNPYSIRDLGNWAYTHHKEFDPYLIAVCDGEESWAGPLKDFDWSSLEGCRLVSHNKSFDWAVYLRLVELGLAPAGLDKDWYCSADLSAYLCNRRSLAQAVEFLLGRHVSKDVRDRADGKTWDDMVKEGWADEMIKYGLRDGFDCWQLWDKFSHLWPEKERRISNMNIRQGMLGIGIDVPLLKKYIADLHQSIFEIDKILPWISEGRKPTSPIGVAEQCRKVGIPCPPLKTEDEEGYDLWEATYAPQYPWALQVSNRRSMNKTLKNLQTVEERLRPDGTMGFALKYFGAHTGRYAGEGGFNMQNLKKIPILLGDDFLPLGEDGVLKAAGHFKKHKEWPSGLRPIDARKILTPRDRVKNKFVMCDLAQIEPRVENWMAGNTELLDMIKGGMAIYEAFARNTMGWKGGNLKEENESEYARAKVQMLGLGYGCGWEKFITVAFTLTFGKVRLTEEESKKMVGDFRAGNPKICGENGLWRTLDKGLKDACARKEDFEIHLPSGRVLRYEKPVLRRTIEPDEDGKPVARTQVFAGIGGFRKATYGGKLTENATQAIARDVFVEGVLDMDRQGIETVFSVHDEAITEVPRDFPAREIERLMSQCPEWLPGCPIGAEAKEGDHYKK